MLLFYKDEGRTALERCYCRLIDLEKMKKYEHSRNPRNKIRYTAAVEMKYKSGLALLRGQNGVISG